MYFLVRLRLNRRGLHILANRIRLANANEAIPTNRREVVTKSDVMSSCRCLSAFQLIHDFRTMVARLSTLTVTAVLCVVTRLRGEAES